MPYCHKCGSQVGAADAFCVRCGTAQPTAAVPLGVPDMLSGISPRTASLLCYVPVIGWLAAIMILASARFRHNAKVRFDAFQGLYLFVAWLVMEWVVGPLFHWPFGGPAVYRIIPAMMKAAVFAAWIFMIIKASQAEHFKLPILGELAEKSVTEQR